MVSSVKVLSNPYDSEYGNFAGAVSTVDTKISDFRKFHYEFHNFVPGLKRREGHWAGIEKFLPRLTITAPLLRNRIALTQSFEYRYNRPEVKKAGLQPLHDDTKVESFSSFTRVDFQISTRHTANVNLSLFPQKLNYVGLDTFTPQPSTPNLRQRGYLVGGEDQYVFQSGALIESRASYKTFDLDVRANSAAPVTAPVIGRNGSYKTRADRRGRDLRAGHQTPARIFNATRDLSGFRLRKRGRCSQRQREQPVS
jgi:hypothetical protein